MTNLYFMIKYAVGYLILLFVFVFMEIFKCTLSMCSSPWAIAFRGDVFCLILYS